jgi:hypothetical protein
MLIFAFPIWFETTKFRSPTLYPLTFILYPSLVTSGINYQADPNDKQQEHGCQQTGSTFRSLELLPDKDPPKGSYQGRTLTQAIGDRKSGLPCGDYTQ